MKGCKKNEGVVYHQPEIPYVSEKAYNALRLAMAMQAGNSEVSPP